jgi:hypothetical protein
MGSHRLRPDRPRAAIDRLSQVIDRMVAMSPTKTDPASSEPALETRSQIQNDPDLECRFRELVIRWQAEVAPLSSTTARVQHHSYREIITLGPAVVPLLLRELEQRPNHWFAALRSLTGADPVAPSDRGKIGPMTEAWIKWGKEHGYL